MTTTTNENNINYVFYKAFQSACVAFHLLLLFSFTFSAFNKNFVFFSFKPRLMLTHLQPQERKKMCLKRPNGYVNIYIYKLVNIWINIPKKINSEFMVNNQSQQSNNENIYSDGVRLTNDTYKLIQMLKTNHFKNAGNQRKNLCTNKLSSSNVTVVVVFFFIISLYSCIKKIIITIMIWSVLMRYLT